MSVKVYSSLLHHALEFAAIKHQGQFRKNPEVKIPYISHVACVGLMLARAGYDDEVIAAGILHDVIEDCGVTSRELAEKFSPRVARLVEQVSEPSKTSPWEVRKSAYRQKLETADKEAITIAATDHLHNLQSLKEAYLADASVVDMFKTDMREKMDHENQCLEIFQRRLGDALARECETAVAEASTLLSGK